MEDLQGTLEGLMNTMERPEHMSNTGFMPSHGMYNQNGPYLDSDDDEDDEDERLQNMFLAMGESSTESGESDHYSSDEHLPPPATGSKSVRFRGGPVIMEDYERHERHEDPDDPDDPDLSDEDIEEIPDWFLCQPFQYNKLMIVPLLIGFPMVLLLGGEMLLAVLTIGILITHLIHESASSNSAYHTWMLTIVCVTVVIVYNITPLVVWRSCWYVILLAASFTHVIVTGCWVLLVMRNFPKWDPSLALYLESVVFTAYPSCSAVLFTWGVSMVIGAQYAPYILLSTSFLLFRVFVKPTYSSFVVPECTDDARKIIVEPWTCATMIVWFMVAPSVVYIATSCGAAPSLPVLANVMMFLFILSCSVFVGTFLHVKPILDVFELSAAKVTSLRKVTVITMMVCWVLAIHFHGYQSLLLPLWPLVFLSAWTALALTLAKTEKFQSIGFTVNLVVLSLVLVSQLPWNLSDMIGSWPIQVVYISVMLNSLITSLAVYASRYLVIDIFGVTLLAHSTVFCPSLSVLHMNELTSTSTVIITHIFYIYMVIRMLEVKKILWQHAVLTISVQLTTVIITIETGLGISWSYFLPSLLCLYVIILILVYVMLLEGRSPADTKQLYLSSCVSGVLTLIYVLLEPDVLACISQSNHVILGLGISCIVASVPAIKPMVYHQTPPDTYNKLGVGLLITGLTLVTVQPDLSDHMLDVLKLMLVQCMITGCMLVVMLHRIRSLNVLYLLCLLTGSSAGTVIYSMLYDEMNLMMCTLYDVQVTLWLAMAVCCLKPSTKSHQHLIIMSITSEIVCVVMVVLDLTVDSWYYQITPGRVGATTTLFVVAALIKSQSLIRLPQTSQDVSSTSHLPILGNLATVLCLMLLWSLTPTIPLPTILTTVSSTAVLFFLRQDKRLPVLRHLSHTNHIAPTLTTILLMFILAIIYQSPLLQGYKYFTTGLCAVLELITLIVTLPAIVTYVVVLWCGSFHNVRWYPIPTQVLSILYLTPFFFCFLLAPIATTYNTWIYGVLGIASGTYLWQTKIPLSLV